MVFVLAEGLMAYETAHRAATWGTCTAVVTKVAGGDAESDEIKVAYRYTVTGREYNGELRPEEKDKKKFAQFKQYKVGRPLSVRYDPAEPANSQPSAIPEAMGFAFITFVLPFLAIGVNTLWFGLSGREIIVSRQPNAEKVPPVPGGGLFWVFVLICVAGTVAQLVLSTCLAWPLGLYTGLGILLAFVPGVTWLVVSQIRSWQNRRKTKTAGEQGFQRTVGLLGRDPGRRCGANATRDRLRGRRQSYEEIGRGCGCYTLLVWDYRRICGLRRLFLWEESSTPSNISCRPMELSSPARSLRTAGGARSTSP